MNLLSKLDKLKEIFSRGDQEDQNTIDSWYGEAKRLFLLKSLKEHDGVKYLLQVFSSEINKINEVLLSSDSSVLSDKKRDRLLDRKELAKKYVSLFTDIDEQIDKIEELVDNEDISSV